MDQFERRLSRRKLLQRGAAGAVGLYAAGTFGLAGRAAAADAVTLNWLTWSDHYFPEQLQEVQQKTGIAARPQLFSDDADAYIKVKSGGGGWDMSSEDALWVPKFYDEGLIEAFDIKSFPVAKQLYSAALNVPFWKAGSNQMGYPFGWSSVQIYYNPKYVKTKPDSWHALLDKQYAKKIVLENQPTDLMAMAGIATGAKKPYDMTTDEIANAKDFLDQAQTQRAQARVAESRGRSGPSRTSPPGSRSRTSAPTRALRTGAARRSRSRHRRRACSAGWTRRCC